MNGSEVIVECLIKKKVKHVIGINGGAIIPFFDSLYDSQDRIKTILCRHEQGGAHMGAGFAIYLPQDQVARAQRIAKKHKLKSWNAGFIENGPKQVIIKPKDVVFRGKTLGIR